MPLSSTERAVFILAASPFPRPVPGLARPGSGHQSPDCLSLGYACLGLSPPRHQGSRDADTSAPTRRVPLVPIFVSGASSLANGCRSRLAVPSRRKARRRPTRSTPAPGRCCLGTSPEAGSSLGRETTRDTSVRASKSRMGALPELTPKTFTRCSGAPLLLWQPDSALPPGARCAPSGLAGARAVGLGAAPLAGRCQSQVGSPRTVPPQPALSDRHKTNSKGRCENYSLFSRSFSLSSSTTRPSARWRALRQLFGGWCPTLRKPAPSTRPTS
jgi:hypothetical protein